MCVRVRVDVCVFFLIIVLPSYKSLSFGLPLSIDGVPLNAFQSLFAYFHQNIRGFLEEFFPFLIKKDRLRCQGAFTLTHFLVWNEHVMAGGAAVILKPQ